MGKPEPTPQRFRRKAKGSGTPLTTTEQMANTAVSPSSAVDNMLCNNLIEPNINSELVVSSTEQTSQLSQGLSDSNGPGDAEAQLTDGDMDRRKPSINGDDCVVAADPHLHEDLDRPRDLCLTSDLPEELSGLPHSEITPLCTNQCLDLSACHVKKEDSLVLVIFLTNPSDTAIQQILVQVKSEKLEVIYAVEDEH